MGRTRRLRECSLRGALMTHKGGTRVGSDLSGGKGPMKTQYVYLKAGTSQIGRIERKDATPWEKAHDLNKRRTEAMCPKETVTASPLYICRERAGERKG